MNRTLKASLLVATFGGGVAAGMLFERHGRRNQPTRADNTAPPTLPPATFNERQPTDGELQLVMVLTGPAGWPREHMQFGTENGQPYVLFTHKNDVIRIEGVDCSRTFVITRLNDGRVPERWQQVGLKYNHFLGMADQ